MIDLKDYTRVIECHDRVVRDGRASPLKLLKGTI